MTNAASDADKNRTSARVSRHDPLWVDDSELILPQLDPDELTRILRTGKVRPGRLTPSPDGGVLGVHPDDIETLARWGAIYTLQRGRNIPVYRNRMRRLRAVNAEAAALGEEFSSPELRWDEGEGKDNLLHRQVLRALLEEFQEVWHRHGGQGQGLGNDKQGHYVGPVVELAEYVLRQSGIQPPSRGSMKDAWRERPSDKGRTTSPRKARYAGSA